MHKKRLLTFLIGTTLSACTMVPDYETPVYSAAPTWHSIPGYESERGARAAAHISWREFFQSPQMQFVISTALEHNKNYRTAAINVEQARTLYRIDRTDLLPNINANGSVAHTGYSDKSSSTGHALHTSYYGANIGLAAYEVDLFGRVRSNNESSLNEYLATEAAKETVKLSLISETANAYLQLLSDHKLLALTKKTLEAQQKTLDIVTQSQEKGVSTSQDVARAQTAVEHANVNYHQYVRYVEQDKNALIVLMGMPYDEALFPQDSLDDVRLVNDIDESLPSETLISRPDIRGAEFTLMARNADIGAARAAFFPNISLTTGTYGFQSLGLSKLFSNGAFGAWTFVPQITMPIFEGGRNIANLELAELQKDAAIIAYEQAIENAFREVSDALAARETLTKQLEAQRRLVAAAQKVYDLSEARYKSGVDSFLSLLDSQRELYAYQQAEIATHQHRLANLVTLYKVLGGGMHALSYPSPDPKIAPVIEIPDASDITVQVEKVSP